MSPDPPDVRGLLRFVQFVLKAGIEGISPLDVLVRVKIRLGPTLDFVSHRYKERPLHRGIRSCSCEILWNAWAAGSRKVFDQIFDFEVFRPFQPDDVE